MNTRRTLAAASLLLALGACGDGATGPEPDALRIEAPATELTEGKTLTLSAISAGQPVPAGRVRWESRDPTTLTVRPDGEVRAVAPGVTHVIARAGQEVDSVRLTVRFASRAPGMVTVRVSGDGAPVVRLGGAALMMGQMDAAPTNTLLNAGDVPSGTPYPDTWWADSLVSLNLPGAPRAGLTMVPAPQVRVTPDFNVEGFGVYLRVRESALRYRVYVAATEARLEVSSLALPPAPGVAVGNVAGSLSFEAAPFLVQIDSPSGRQTITPIGNRTVPVYAEFLVPIHHRVHGSFMFNVAGGRYPASERMGGAADVVNGGLSLRFGAVQAGEHPDAVLLESRVWLPTPAEGEHVVRPAALVQAMRQDTAGGAWPWAWLKAQPLVPMDGGLGWDTPQLALSQGGTVTITRYRPPTATAYGQVVGRLDVTYTYAPAREGDTPARATADFAIPVTPLNGVPF